MTREKNGRPLVLLIDDDPEFCEDLLVLLEDRFRVYAAFTVEEGLALAKKYPIDLVLLDVIFGEEKSGLRVIDDLLSDDRDLPILMLTEDRSFDTAVEAIKRGAFHYVAKPPDVRDLVLLMERALEARSTKRKLRDSRLEAALLRVGLHWWDDAMRPVVRAIGRFGPSDMAVLITGESGVGKELVAKALHEMSPRAEKSELLKVPCTDLQEGMDGNELFGHEEGAYTDARQDFKGLIASAEGGTLFLDEIGDAVPSTQKKLLRFLEDSEYRQLGSTETRTADVRVLTATNKDLRKEMDEGRFRNDLYYRVFQFPIHIPPLRARKDDILPLARHFLDEESETGKLSITPDGREALLQHHWPGNVRELKTVIRRAVLDRRGYMVDPSLHIAAGVSSPGDLYLPFTEAKKKAEQCFEREYMNRRLEETGGNVTRAAEKSGLSRGHFHDLLNKHGIRAEDFRERG